MSERAGAQPLSRRAGRLEVVDGLRGLASLAVCWYHLVFANHAFLEAGLLATFLRDSARNAWVGVEVFFVISGFVVPLALHRSGYGARSYGTFLVKRIVRLDPPYLVSIVLCLVLAYVSARIHRVHGAPFDVSLEAVLLHIGYFNAFVGKGWLNPVYWTLAIEFQYYLGVGLVFSALAHGRWVVRLASFVCLGGLAFLIPSPSLVFHYLFVFMLGMATFQYFVGLQSARTYVPALALLAAGCYLTLGPMVAGLAVTTALAIATVRRSLPVLTLLGSISYSLYLVHVPVGGRVMDLGLPHAHSVLAKCAILAVALAASVGAAFTLYVAVERPAQRWSSGIRYGRRLERVRPEGEGTGIVATGIAEP